MLSINDVGVKNHTPQGTKNRTHIIVVLTSPWVLKITPLHFKKIVMIRVSKKIPV